MPSRWMNAPWKAWRDRAGVHCQHVHEAIVEQGRLDLVHVQADEIRVKGRSMVVWMGLAMMVSTRLWLAGAVNPTRDRHLADRLLTQVRACALGVRALLVATDGWAAYPKSIQRAFREKIKETAGRGRACLRIWENLCMVTVIKRTEKQQVVEVTRRLSWGKEQQANDLLKQSQGGSVWNTAFIERLNGTMRERLASLTRKCRHAAHRASGARDRYVSDRLHLQLVLPASRIKSRQAYRLSVYACDGIWLNRSHLECWGSSHL
jgi:IS1 family transposase